MKIVVILNGAKKNAHRLAEQLKHQTVSIHEIRIFFTTYSQHATEIAAETARNCELLVAVGGDGTMHECAEGLLQFRKLNPGAALPMLTLIPNGTGNDFARNFGLQNRENELALRIEEQKVVSLDAALLSNHHGEQWFINIADAGLGPDVVKKVLKMPRILPGKLQFRLAALLAFFQTRKREMSFSSDGFVWRGKALMIAVCNGKYFGNGIGIAPDADPSDGLLDITIIGNVSWLTYIRYLSKLTSAQRIVHPEVHYFKSKKIELGFNGEIETDGELCPLQLPVTVECYPGVLSLLV